MAWRRFGAAISVWGAIARRFMGPIESPALVRPKKEPDTAKNTIRSPMHIFDCGLRLHIA